MDYNLTFNNQKVDAMSLIMHSISELLISNIKMSFCTTLLLAIRRFLSTYLYCVNVIALTVTFYLDYSSTHHLLPTLVLSGALAKLM